MIAVVTNIDADHLGSYEGDLGRLKQGFLDFLHNLPFYGLAVLCSDDDNTRELIPRLGRRVVSYGFGERADFRASTSSGSGCARASRCISKRARASRSTFELNLPGLHNVLNSLAAVAVAAELEIADAALEARARRVLRASTGASRCTAPSRPAAGRVTFVDDYGHHPTELAATIAAARDAWPDRRLVVVFQPHRYTRTHALLDDFAQVLSTVDALVLTNVYSAGETPLAGADGKSLARAVRVRGAVEPIFIEELARAAGRARADPARRRRRAHARRRQHRRDRADAAAHARRARAGRGAEVSAVARTTWTAAAPPLRNEPMRRHTSWRVGGPADLLLRAARASRSCSAIPARAAARTCRCIWLGLGLEPARARRRHPRRRDRDRHGCRASSSGSTASACARAPACRARCSRAQCVRWQLGPAAFFAGIPGTRRRRARDERGRVRRRDVDARRARHDDRPRAAAARARERAEFDVGYRQRARPGRASGSSARRSRSRPTRRRRGGSRRCSRAATRRSRSGSRAAARCSAIRRAIMPAGSSRARGSKARASAARSSPTKHANFIVNDGDATRRRHRAADRARAR